jgi:NADH-quinone oxidoreductase subunit G
VLVLDSDPINDAPILDLRLRKGVRRHDVKLIRATAGDLRDGADELTGRLSQAGPEIVVLWGERLTAGPEGAANARALLDLAATLSLAATEGAGLLEIPAVTNGRGLREAGVLPNADPGLTETASPTGPGGSREGSGEGGSRSGRGLDTGGIARALAERELTSLYLLQADPLGDGLPERELWERALERAATVVAHASFPTEGIRAHATVVFPAESYAEKEGTLVHPDGRIQRLRPAIAHPGSVEAGWRVLAELARRLGRDVGVRTAGMASQQLFDAVPFYAGLTLEEIGGKGVRWQERPQASAYGGADPSPPVASGEAPGTGGFEGEPEQRP